MNIIIILLFRFNEGDLPDPNMRIFLTIFVITTQKNMLCGMKKSMIIQLHL